MKKCLQDLALAFQILFGIVGGTRAITGFRWNSIEALSPHNRIH